MAHGVSDLMQRSEPWRSEKHLKWVRSLSCANCGEIGPSEAHHLIGISGYGAMGNKAGDQFAMPLCRACHDDLHHARITLGDQWYWWKRTIERGFNEGHLGVIA